MKNLYLSLMGLGMLLSSSCAPATPTIAPSPTETATAATAAPAAPTATSQAFRSMNMIRIDAPSLEENLVGEPAQRTISVYLPPSYGSSEKRYPVVYYLPGYGDSSVIGFQLPNDMDALIESGQANEMILVVASGDSRMGGSFYVNSPVTGNWEDYLVKDSTLR